MVEVVVVLFALMWLAACAGKLDAWATWQQTARKVAVRPKATALFGVSVPIAELALVALLLASPRAGLLASGVMLAAMAGGVAWLARSHAGAACGCFGAMTRSTISWKLAAFDGVTGLAALTIAALVPKVGTPELALALFVLVGAAVAWVLLEAMRIRLLVPARPKVSA